MLKYENKGYTIEIKLPEECGYKGYSVEKENLVNDNAS